MIVCNNCGAECGTKLELEHAQFSSKEVVKNIFGNDKKITGITKIGNGDIILEYINGTDLASWR